MPEKKITNEKKINYLDVDNNRSANTADVINPSVLGNPLNTIFPDCVF